MRALDDALGRLLDALSLDATRASLLRSQTSEPRGSGGLTEAPPTSAASASARADESSVASAAAIGRHALATLPAGQEATRLVDFATALCARHTHTHSRGSIGALDEVGLASSASAEAPSDDADLGSSAGGEHGLWLATLERLVRGRAARRLGRELPHVAAAVRGALGELTRNALAAASPYVPLPSVVGAVVAGAAPGSGASGTLGQLRDLVVGALETLARDEAVCEAGRRVLDSELSKHARASARARAAGVRVDVVDGVPVAAKLPPVTESSDPVAGGATGPAVEASRREVSLEPRAREGRMQIVRQARVGTSRVHHAAGTRAESFSARMGWGVPIIVARAAVTRDPLTALDGVPRNLGHGFQRGPRLPGMLPPQPRFWSEIDPELVDPELSKQPI